MKYLLYLIKWSVRPVALRGRAWIEMIYTGNNSAIQKCRPPREGVD